MGGVFYNTEKSLYNLATQMSTMAVRRVGVTLPAIYVMVWRVVRKRGKGTRVMTGGWGMSMMAGRLECVVSKIVSSTAERY